MLKAKDLEDVFKDDRFIYHYTNYNTAIEYILYENTLLFSKVNRTNDPLEFESIIHCAGWNGNIDVDERWRLIEIGKESNHIVKNKFKICCFCIDKDIDEFTDYVPHINKGYCRSRMWSQYGGSHKGVCLVFNKSRLLEIIKKDFDYVVAEEITYKNDLSNLLDITSIEYETDRDTIPLERVKKYIHEYLFQKLADYKSEQEYRIAVYADDESNSTLVNFEDSLVGIILGVRFPDIYEINIRNAMKFRKLPIFRIGWFHGKPELFEVENDTY
jgi:hypothetical protein